MLRGVVTTQQATFVIPSNGGVGYDFDTLAKAKAATQAYITTNKASFSNGYDAYVLDTDSHQIVSFATIPQPTLNWQDTSISPPATTSSTR